MSVSNINNKAPESSLRKKLKRDHALYNPCIEEYNASLKCLDKNNYGREKCTQQFSSYIKCRKIWNKIITSRRINNMEPVIPPPEERAKIKDEFLKSQKM